MAFMNGGFRWTVIISLALGTWLAGTVATLQLREMSDRRITDEAVKTALAAHDSMASGAIDSLMANDARIMAGITILQERGYRLYDDVTDLEGVKKKPQHAHKETERDERRRWP